MVQLNNMGISVRSLLPCTHIGILKRTSRVYRTRVKRLYQVKSIDVWRRGCVVVKGEWEEKSVVGSHAPYTWI